MGQNERVLEMYTGTAIFFVGKEKMNIHNDHSCRSDFRDV